MVFPNTQWKCVWNLSTLRHHNRKQLWLTTKLHSFERLSLNNSSPEDAFSAHLLHSNLAATSCNFVNQELLKRSCLHPHPPSSTEPRDEVIPNFFCRHLAREIDPPANVDVQWEHLFRLNTLWLFGDKNGFCDKKTCGFLYRLWCFYHNIDCIGGIGLVLRIYCSSPNAIVRMTSND